MSVPIVVLLAVIFAPVVVGTTDPGKVHAAAVCAFTFPVIAKTAINVNVEIGVFIDTDYDWQEAIRLPFHKKLFMKQLKKTKTWRFSRIWNAFRERDYPSLGRSLK